jgi:hypothetical protein
MGTRLETATVARKHHLPPRLPYLLVYLVYQSDPFFSAATNSSCCYSISPLLNSRISLF